jgi:hypothetical protein
MTPAPREGVPLGVMDVLLDPRQPAVLRGGVRRARGPPRRRSGSSAVLSFVCGGLHKPLSVGGPASWERGGVGVAVSIDCRWLRRESFENSRILVM